MDGTGMADRDLPLVEAYPQNRDRASKAGAGGPRGAMAGKEGTIPQRKAWPSGLYQDQPSSDQEKQNAQH